LLKIVENDGNDNQVLYWVTPGEGDTLVFTALVNGGDIAKLLAAIKAAVGTTEDDIPAYLLNLPENFRNITEIADQLNHFLNEKSEDPDTIDTWPELGDFLAGYKDTDVLIDIIGAIRTVLEQALVGVGLDATGAYVPDDTTTYLTEATSVMDALKILDGILNKVKSVVFEANNDGTLVPLTITQDDEKVVFKADLKVSAEPGQGLIKKDDGLYIKVYQEYKLGILNLTVNDIIVSQVPIGLNFIGIESATYDTQTECLVIVFKLFDGTFQRLEISLANLIREWDTDNTSLT
jgi:hypothetical protein